MSPSLYILPRTQLSLIPLLRLMFCPPVKPTDATWRHLSSLFQPPISLQYNIRAKGYVCLYDVSAPDGYLCSLTPIRVSLRILLSLKIGYLYYFRNLSCRRWFDDGMVLMVLMELRWLCWKLDILSPLGMSKTGDGGVLLLAVLIKWLSSQRPSNRSDQIHTISIAHRCSVLAVPET